MALSGVLPSTAAHVVPTPRIVVPTAVTLKSALAGRLIELSTDGGVEYFTPSVDNTSATMQVVAIKAPVTHVRLTGSANDAWSIL